MHYHPCVDAKYEQMICFCWNHFTGFSLFVFRPCWCICVCNTEIWRSRFIRFSVRRRGFFFFSSSLPTLSIAFVAGAGVKDTLSWNRLWILYTVDSVYNQLLITSYHLFTQLCWRSHTSRTVICFVSLSFFHLTKRLITLVFLSFSFEHLKHISTDNFKLTCVCWM